MKKQLLFLFSLLMSICVHAQFSGTGSGTKADPYLITSAGELNQVRNFLQNPDVCFKLMRDLDLTEWLSENSPSQGWMPIGTKDVPFQGTFDGNGKTVKLFINRPDNESVGFMGGVNGATLKNLTIKGNIAGGKTYTGGFVGYSWWSKSLDCTIENCHFSGKISASEKSNYVGGIVGYTDGANESGYYTHISKSSFSGEIRGGKLVGGIAGSGYMADIQSCRVDANIESAEYKVGGIIGYIYPGKTSYKSYPGSGTWIKVNSEISDCSVIGSLKGNYAGGVVGVTSSLDVCRNLVGANVEGANAGGVCGGENDYVSVSGTTIAKNVVTSKYIKGTESVGRISGTSETSFGDIGTQNTNYVLGTTEIYLKDEKQTLTDSRQNGELCGKSVLAEKATYEGLGWDMKNVWGMSSVTDLPYLLCMGEDANEDNPDTSPNSYDNTLLLGDVTTAAGKEFELPILLKNAVDISAFQFDLYLPEGFTVAVDEDGLEKIEVGSRSSSRRHVIDCARQKDGSLRVVCYSMKNYNFENTDGDVAKVCIKAPAGIADGTYSVVLKNIVLSTAKSEKFEVAKILGTLEVNSTKPGDINNDGTLNVADVTGLVAIVLGESSDEVPSHVADLTGDGKIQVNDVVALVNLILTENAGGNTAMAAPRLQSTATADYSKDIEIEPFTIRPGEEKAIRVLLNNVGAQYTGWQADFHFPEGISAVKDEYGYYIDVTSDRTSTRLHTIASAQQSDGSVRVMSYSMKNALFKGEHGAVAEITVKAADNLAPGTYTLRATNVVLSGTDAVAVYPPETSATALSADGGRGCLNLLGSYDEAALSAFSTALSTNTAVTSIDLTAAYSVENGMLTSGNPNLLLYVSENAAPGNATNVVKNGTCADLSLNDGFAFAAPQAFVATRATLNRNFTKGQKSTLCLPFAVENPQAYGAFFAFERYDADQGLVCFSRADNLTANTAYVFNPSVEKLEFSEVEVSATPANLSSPGQAGLYGTLEPLVTPITMSANMNVYGYAASDIPSQGITAGQFVKAGNNVSVLPFRAFLALPAAQSPQQVRSYFPGETTGICSPTEQTSANARYNLKGQRLFGPAKGVYVEKGKKVFVK